MQPPVLYQQLDDPSMAEGAHPVGSGGQIQSVFGDILGQAILSAGDIPLTATPTITQGDPLGAGPITLMNLTSSVLIQFNLTVDSDALNSVVVISIFRNNTCIGAVMAEVNANSPTSISATHVDVLPGAGSPSSPESITYSGRIGTDGGGETLGVNQTVTGANDLGGQLHSYFVLTELK